MINQNIIIKLKLNILILFKFACQRLCVLGSGVAQGIMDVDDLKQSDWEGGKDSSTVTSPSFLQSTGNSRLIFAEWQELVTLMIRPSVGFIRVRNGGRLRD